MKIATFGKNSPIRIKRHFLRNAITASNNKLVPVFSPWRRDFILLGVFLFQAARFLLFPLLHFLLLVFGRLLKGEKTHFFSTTEPLTAEHRVVRSIAINWGFRVSAPSRLQCLCGNVSHRFHQEIGVGVVTLHRNQCASSSRCENIKAFQSPKVIKTIITLNKLFFFL